MVPKRKKSTMALMQEDVALGDESTSSAPSDAPLRRSERNKSARRGGHGMYPDSQAAEVLNTPSQTARARLRKDRQSNRGGMEKAMDGLKEFEGSLQESLKRQMLAIKSSAVMNEKEAGDDFVFHPRPASNVPDSLPSVQQEKLLDREKNLKRDQNPHMPPGNNEDPDDREAERDGEIEDSVATKTEGARPPPVNSEYLPLPWKGRLGYACLNTYLRLANPPVFSSRTCRISSILEHRHPLRDPSQPEHPTKNRPDKDQPADVERGQKYVEVLGLANARDIVKMLRWNDKYGIKFMRLSSEMFPFASHEEYGYKLAPFASEVLAEAGRVAGGLGHRLTTHPGQFTQLGSPRKDVVAAAIRDIEYHDEMLTLLRLPEQLNKDAVMILHVGGMFGDKQATLQRFRENYARLSDSAKARLVLENDDVCWTVHDILPLCEELNIPLVLDFHHHNILFDAEQVCEGTRDIVGLFPRIKATWDRKGITQKMHYSEPCPEAITRRERRKHRPRVLTLPPCPNDMDLMIEAKDKEQAVFDLMRNFKLPGWNLFNDVVPYEREDENKPLPKPKTPKKPRKQRKGGKGGEEVVDVDMEDLSPLPEEIPPEEIGMGGPNRRVYWPIGMEEWLRPKKKAVKRKKDEDKVEDGDGSQ